MSLPGGEGTSGSSDGGGKYPIYSTKSPKKGEFTVTADSNIDKFLAFLESQSIVLEKKPDPSAKVDDSDDLKQWFDKFGKDSQITVNVEISEQTQQITSLEFGFTMPWDGSPTVCFSSSSEAIDFSFGGPATIQGAPSARVPIPGIDEDGKLLYCGLDPNQTGENIQITVGDVLKYVGQEARASAMPAGLADMKLTMDPIKEAGKRNALWFNASFYSETTLRLQFHVDGATSLKQLLETKLPGFTVEAVDVICKKTLIAAQTEDGPAAVDQGDIAFDVQCKITPKGNSAIGVNAALEFLPGSIRMTLQFNSESDPLGGILAWLVGLIGNDVDLVKDLMAKDIFQNVKLRQMSLTVDTEGESGPSLSSFGLSIEVSANFGQVSGGKPALFLVSYSWVRGGEKFGTVLGKLWTSFDNDPNRDLTPHYETWEDLQPTVKDPARALDLRRLVPGNTVENIPPFIPSQLTRASITLSQDTFTIGGTITTNKATIGQMPHPYLGELQLDASYNWGDQKGFTFAFGVMATLEASPSATRPNPTDLWGQLKYDSIKKTWALTAGIRGFYGSSLYELFDSTSAPHAMPLIDSLAVQRLVLSYQYAKAELPADSATSATGEVEKDSPFSGSSFTVTGTVLVAGLRLALTYKYDKKGWDFNATMEPQNKNTTVDQIVASILGEDTLELPDFLGQTAFTPNDKLSLKLDQTGKGAEKSMHFLATLQLGEHMALTFVQYHGADWGPKTPSKRLVKVAVQGLRQLQVPEIPLIGKIDQPVQEISYMWIQDPVPKKSTGQPGLTRKEVNDLDASLGGKKLVWKEKFAADKQKDEDLIFPAGSHFMILSSDATGASTCLLDYAFQARGQRPSRAVTAPARAAPGGAAGEPSSGQGDDATNENDAGDATSAQAPLKKKTGPLSLKNVGLKYTDKKLHIMLDATFHLGPVEFSLIGFSIGLEIKSLSEVPKVSQPELQGLAAAFDKPPLTIAGVIRHSTTPALEYYAGGLIVAFNPWQFEAAGFYGEAKPDNGTPFKSLFLFARLNGPLFELEFAEISALTGGFGYNSDVRTPAPDQVVDFPFVATKKLGDGGDNIVATLEKITDPGAGGWFHPQTDMYWAAAGLKVDAFQMLSIDAVLVVQFGASVKVGVFAVAVADIPTTKAKEGPKFAHVELGLAATLDIDYGTFKLEAQLSPKSYILHPDCHLTGGFGLYYWFDAPHADKGKVGSFVLTLGGYHQAFKIPDGYPRPPRLGISWNLGRNLSISGEAYFAITPKACMGGGRLHASFSAGPIEAWFDAFADFLINYKPFHFLASAGISVGVRFNIDVWFVHTHISVEISADLTLWGPPVAGRVHVDFWITAFDINFGDSPPAPDPVSLLSFYELVLQASSQASPSSTAAIEESGAAAMDRPMNEAHLFLVKSGLLNSSDKKDDTEKGSWTVRAGTFSFVVGCKMAINVATQGGKDLQHDQAPHAKPMQLDQNNPLVSKLSVKITQEGVQDDNPKWRMEKQLKAVPRALWDPYSRDMDPTKGGNNIDQLLDEKDGSVPLMMGVQFTVPLPHLPPKPLPAYDIEKAGLVPLSATQPFPPSIPAQQDWEPTPSPPKPDDPTQWETLHKTWRDPPMGTGSEGQSGFVSKWATAFGWDKSLSEVAGLPQGMDARFKSLFVAAPLLSR
ncbi:hypothetical protein BDW42DRAFT_196492 [Aspergillus taichungensis]|uniref:DUF6603 domain-containing protein n=1 Tax=Aspergillus taichungensis TaxID=482145 RepID=A0A2J5HKB1_9EURO|nr:hypothetical protein BDW42DRAFT_196492 [Aspergillus taichungensis]